jgi:hypothetical protein
MKNVARVNPKGYVVMVRARHAFDFTKKAWISACAGTAEGLDQASLSTSTGMTRAGQA